MFNRLSCFEIIVELIWFLIWEIILESLVECEHLYSIGGSSRFQAFIGRALRLPFNAFIIIVIKVSFGSMIANARLPASRTRRRIVSSSAFSEGMNSAPGFHAFPVSGSRSESSTVGSVVSSRAYINRSGGSIHYPIRLVFASCTVLQLIMPLITDSFRTICFCCWLPVCMMFAWNQVRRYMRLCSEWRSMRILAHVVPLLTMVPVLFSNGTSINRLI